MGILSQSGDLVYTMRFLRLLTTKWEDTNAFKLGLIDNTGKKIKKPVLQAEKDAYNLFHRLVYNIKKLINQVPGGKSKFASYASALLLLREHFDLSDDNIKQILEELGIKDEDCLGESAVWYQTKDGMLSPGTYKLDVEDKMINTTLEEFGKKNDKVVVEMDTYPVDNLLGFDVYEVIHSSTGQKMYVTAGELSK
jgi:hypothetical protein